MHLSDTTKHINWTCKARMHSASGLWLLVHMPEKWFISTGILPRNLKLQIYSWFFMGKNPVGLGKNTRVSLKVYWMKKLALHETDFLPHQEMDNVCYLICAPSFWTCVVFKFEPEFWGLLTQKWRFRHIYWNLSGTTPCGTTTLSEKTIFQFVNISVYNRIPCKLNLSEQPPVWKDHFFLTSKVVVLDRFPSSTTRASMLQVLSSYWHYCTSACLMHNWALIWQNMVNLIHNLDPFYTAS